MKKLFFSPNLALLLIPALILPPSYAPSRVSLSNHPPELTRKTLRQTNAGMEESKVRGQIKDALDPPAGLEEPGPRGENRRPEFLIRPEEVLLYRKRAGESTDRKVPNSIWNHLPPDFRDAALLTPLESGSEGLVLLTRNSLLEKTSSGFNLDSVPVTYEMNVSRLPNDSEMKRILNGTWVRVRGPRGNGNGNGSGFFKPVNAEPIRGEGSGGRLRITFSHGSRQLARAMLETRAMDASGPMRATFGSIELNGMPPGGYRRARWKELLALADLYGIEALSAGRRTPQQEIAIQEEAVDQELILGLLENEQYLRNVFEEIFSWPDLAKRSVEGQDIVHVWEGGFKRVYRVALNLKGEPAPFSFYVKIVKPDVVRSDSDYLYDASYVNRMTEVAARARQKFLFLHPPSAPNQFLSDRMGRSRIVFSEGAIFPTNARWASSEARRLVIETYMKLYLVFDGKVFLEDPKPANTVLHRLSRQRYEGTIVDLDNLLEVGHGLHDSSVVFQLLDYGFRTDEIIPAMENILGTLRTLELLGAAHLVDRFLGIRRSDLQDRYPDSRQRLQQSIVDGKTRLPLLLPASTRIMLNEREQIVPEGVTLADLLSDRYVNIQSISVRVNESPLPEESEHPLSVAKRWALYDRTPVREGWSITWVPVEKPTPEPEEKPGEERIHVHDRKVKIRDLRQTGFDRELGELRDALAWFRRDLTGRHVAENEYFRAAHHALGRLIPGIRRYLKQPLIYPLNRRRLEAAARAFDRVDFKNEDDRRQQRQQLTELINTGIALDGRFREAMNSDPAPAAGVEETKEILSQGFGSATDRLTAEDVRSIRRTDSKQIATTLHLYSRALADFQWIPQEVPERVLLEMSNRLISRELLYSVPPPLVRKIASSAMDVTSEADYLTRKLPGIEAEIRSYRAVADPDDPWGEAFRGLLQEEDQTQGRADWAETVDFAVQKTVEAFYPNPDDFGAVGKIMWFRDRVKTAGIRELLRELAGARASFSPPGNSVYGRLFYEALMARLLHTHFKVDFSLPGSGDSQTWFVVSEDPQGSAAELAGKVTHEIVHQMLEETGGVQRFGTGGVSPADWVTQAAEELMGRALAARRGESTEPTGAPAAFGPTVRAWLHNSGRRIARTPTSAWTPKIVQNYMNLFPPEWVHYAVGHLVAGVGEELGEEAARVRTEENPYTLSLSFVLNAFAQAGKGQVHLNELGEAARKFRARHGLPEEYTAGGSTELTTGLEEPIKSSLEIYGQPLGGPEWLGPADLRFPESGGKRPISDEVLFKAIGRLPDVLRDDYISDSGLAYYRYKVSPRSVLPGEQRAYFNDVIAYFEDKVARGFKVHEIEPTTAAGLEEGSEVSVEVAEGMARMNDFLGQVGSDPSVLFGAGLHDLTESFGKSPAIEAFTREGVRPLLVVLPGRLSLPGASLDSPVLKLLVDPKYDRALREQLSFALVSGIVEITVDPSAARFVVGDRDFVRNQKENRLVSREATFLQVDPSTISSLTRDFLTLVAAYRPGAVLVVGTQTEHAGAVVLFESA